MPAVTKKNGGGRRSRRRRELMKQQMMMNMRDNSQGMGLPSADYVVPAAVQFQFVDPTKQTANNEDPKQVNMRVLLSIINSKDKRVLKEARDFLRNMCKLKGLDYHLFKKPTMSQENISATAAASAAAATAAATTAAATAATTAAATTAAATTAAPAAPAP
jgi:hypothetical protein